MKKRRRCPLAFRDRAEAEGRWLSPDPAGWSVANPADPQSWNRYAYMADAPELGHDPLGLCHVDHDSAAVFCIDVYPPKPPPAGQPPQTLQPIGGRVINWTGIGSNPIRSQSASPTPPGVAPQSAGPSCSQARAAVGKLGEWASGQGRALLLEGIAAGAATAFASVLAPEALPAEAAGAELTAALIDASGGFSALGATLQGYASGGVGEAAAAAVASVLIEKVGGALAGRVFASFEPGLQQGAGAALKNIPGVILDAEVACGG